MTTNPYIAGFVDGYAAGYVRGRLGLSSRDDVCAACRKPILMSSVDRLLCWRCTAPTGSPESRESEAARTRTLSAAGGGTPLPSAMECYALARLQEVYAAKRRLPR